MAMKRANGDGSVYKIGGKRRKPFGARVTIGWQLDPETGRSKQIYQSIGTFATRVEAETALNNYLQNPYDIEAHKITFAGVYDRWSAEYFETLKNPSSARSYKAAYAYCEPLYNIRMRDIRVEHMQGVIKDAEVGDATKGRMKSLFNLMYKWCMIHEVVEKDYSALFVHKAGKRDKTKRVPFKNSEIQKLWKMQDFSVADMILFALYSGFRPSEVTLIETRFVDLVRWRIKGGMKTEAGIDRIVPIHEKIRPIVQKHYNPDSKFLFTNEKGEYMTYDQYRGRFKNVMRALGTTHTPHETRHTFISCAKHFDVDENLLKAIVGHKNRNVTEVVYTHRPFSDYVAAVALIDYSGEDIEFESIDADWD